MISKTLPRTDTPCPPSSPMSHSLAATSDVNKAPWDVILAYTYLEQATAAAAAAGDSPPSRPLYRAALSLAGFLAGLPKGDHGASILHHVPPPDRPHLLTVAEYLADSRLEGVFSDVDHLDDRFVPHKILNRFAWYATGIPALRSYLKRGKLPGDSAMLAFLLDGCRELPVDVAINYPRRFKRKHVAMVMDYDGDLSLSIGRPKPNNVEQSRHVPSLLLQQTQLNRVGNVHVAAGDEPDGFPARSFLETWVEQDIYKNKFAETSKLVGVVGRNMAEAKRSANLGMDRPANTLSSKNFPPMESYLKIGSCFKISEESQNQQFEEPIWTMMDYTINGVVASKLENLLSRLPTVQGRSPSALFNVAHDYSTASPRRRLGSSSPPSLFNHVMYHRPLSDSDSIRRHRPSTDFTSTPRTYESIENAGFVCVNMPEQNREEMVENNDIQPLGRRARGGGADENRHALRDAVNFISAVASAMSIQSGPWEKLPVPVLFSTFLPKICIGFCMAMVFNYENMPLSTKKRFMIMGTVLAVLALNVVIGVCSSFGII